jgi:hypothetical protein
MARRLTLAPVRARPVRLGAALFAAGLAVALRPRRAKAEAR